MTPTQTATPMNVALENDSPASVQPAPASPDRRCQHSFANGARCRLFIPRPGASFCLSHVKLHQTSEVAAILTADLSEFKSAEALNLFLSRLLLVLAENRISPRRASVLAYIGSQILRTVSILEQKQAAESAEAPPKVVIDIPGASRDHLYRDEQDDPSAYRGW